MKKASPVGEAFCGGKKLSDELGRKVSVDELEEFAGITEDEISNILKLAGEELPPEEK